MTVNPRQSFKLKLALSILVVSFVTFMLIFSATFYFTSKEIKDSVANIVTSKLALATKALDDRLLDLEIASDNLVSLMESPVFRYDSGTANEMGKEYLDANPHVQGVCIGYEDGSAFGHEGPWCPYVMHQGDEFVIMDLATTKEFWKSEWYSTAASSLTKTWSEPFRESNGTVIVSYNVPLVDKATGKLICVVAVDQNLNELSDSLQTLSPYDGSALFLVDNEGRYLAHPDHSKVLESSIPEQIGIFLNSEDKHLSVKENGEETFFFKSTIQRTGWTVLMSVPRSAMVSRSSRMLKYMLLDMLLGLILLLTVSIYVISRLTRPLESFAEAARKFSHGDFDVELPAIKEHNELYDLRSALVSMKSSLDIYVSRLEETSAKKASIERELNIARSIQMAMVPKIFPPYPNRDNIDIYASLKPAQAVGGDLYDFVLCGDKFFFCIGDVSGKGVPASLLMAITRTLFRNTASADKTPSDIAAILNESICEGNDMGMFVTMAIGCYDLMSGELHICNCGHNLPATNGAIIDKSSMKADPAASFHLINGVPTNIAIGVVPGFEFKEIMMNITPGCLLLLYTDGVTEAENAAHELYDESRMLACIEANAQDASCETIVKALVDDVTSFVGDADQNDDITILCLRSMHLG